MLRLSEIIKSLPPQEGEETEYVHPGVQHVVYLKKGRLADLMAIVAGYGGAAVAPPEELNAFEFVLRILIPYGCNKDFLADLDGEGLRYLGNV
jgi:hypothetical protein